MKNNMKGLATATATATKLRGRDNTKNTLSLKERDFIMPLISRIIATVIAAATALATSACAATPDGEMIIQPANRDERTNLTHLGPATDIRPVRKGHIVYSPVDNLGRAHAAYGSLTTELRAQAKHRGRGNNPEDTNANPAGWGHNKIVTVHFPGGDSYHGYFYNRSHLIADSLGGKAAQDSWITGTRMQNVGTNDGKGGMAYTETIARKYLDNPAHSNCPLYYGVVPQYHSTELIPRSVVVDIQSCDKSINERVVVHNDAPGYEINYQTGVFGKKK